MQRSPTAARPLRVADRATLVVRSLCLRVSVVILIQGDASVGRLAARRVDRARQDLLLAIEAAEREVVDRELGVQTEARGLQVGGGCLGCRAVCLDDAVQPTPYIRLVRGVDRQHDVGIGVVKRGGGAVRRRAPRGDGRDADDLRIEIRTRAADGRTRLRELRFRDLQRLVGDLDALLEPGERRIGEHVPPRSAHVCVTRLRRFPVLDLLVGRQRGRRRRLVTRRRRAGGSREQGGGDRRAERHGCAAAAAAATTRTVCAGDSESGGLLTTRSLPVRPDRISTISPKSRPLLTVTSAIRFCASTVATCRPSPLKISASTGSSSVVAALGSLMWTSAYEPGSSSLRGLSTSISVSSVRDATSIAFDVRARVPVKRRPGNSFSVRSADSPAVAARE